MVKKYNTNSIIYYLYYSIYKYFIKGDFQYISEKLDLIGVNVPLPDLHFGERASGNVAAVELELC